MDTLEAYARGQASQGKELMVFDWDTAARLIREMQPRVVSAGLRGDWNWTGGTIYEDERPVLDCYTYLASTWAVPEIDLDGKCRDCYKMQSEVPDWNSQTKWPDSALAILGSLTEGERSTKA